MAWGDGLRVYLDTDPSVWQYPWVRISGKPDIKLPHDTWYNLYSSTVIQSDEQLLSPPIPLPWEVWFNSHQPPSFLTKFFLMLLIEEMRVANKKQPSPWPRPGPAKQELSHLQQKHRLQEPRLGFPVLFRALRVTEPHQGSCLDFTQEHLGCFLGVFDRTEAAAAATAGCQGSWWLAVGSGRGKWPEEWTEFPSPESVSVVTSPLQASALK